MISINRNLLYISILFGLVFSRIFFEKNKRIVKPEIENNDNIYKDDNGVCYKYKLEKIDIKD